MTRYPTIFFKELMQKVNKFCFKKVRQKGSHIRFEHEDGRKVTIPDHGNRDMPNGLLLKIIRYDLEMELDDFFLK